MFLGWYDPDRKKPARAKLADALERYEEKFNRPATLCLTSPQDAHELNADTAQLPPVTVHPRGYIGRWIFYVGEETADAITVRCTTCGASIIVEYDPADPTDCADLADLYTYALCDTCSAAHVAGTPASA